MNKALPNNTHHALMELEEAGLIKLLVTQNVDGLHQQAGHRQVIDLHGRLDKVICIQCTAQTERSEFQNRLNQENPHLKHASGETAPDGDADVPDELINNVVVPGCLGCGGILKPDVVFYGGNVPKTRTNQIQQALQEVDALLVVGSSLMVFSAFRFCREAHQNQIPLAIVNQGKTRADQIASLKLEADCNLLMPEVNNRL